MTRLLLSFMACACLTVQLHADDLPQHIRRTSAAILGTIESSVDGECVVQRFVDPYPSLSGSQDRREYRWRVRVPNGSKANIVWAHGTLPQEGLPTKGRRMIPAKSLPATPGDIVVVVRASNDFRKEFEISVFPEFPGSSASVQSASDANAHWLPYWTTAKPTLVQLDDKAPTRLEPEGQQVMMKHFVRSGSTNMGYAIWIDFDGVRHGTKP